MPAICFYFQVHQPNRLKNYPYFNQGWDHSYFDEPQNREIIQKVAAKCYIPANRTILKLINQHGGRFKVAYSVTGVALEQMLKHCPEAVESFAALSRTGCVEFLAETYYHSLAAMYDPAEFKQQVLQHEAMMIALFGQRPRVFRNTELICDNRVLELVAGMGYKAMITEGVDDILKWRSPNYLYSKPGGGLKILLKNYGLSDDIAFRFSNRAWSHWPLTASKYAYWVHSLTDSANVINLFMDYETFGEHQWAETGIFKFLEDLPGEILRHGSWSFMTPGETADKFPATGGELDFWRTISWADLQRDLSAWQGNKMQKRALSEIYAIGREVRARNNPSTLDLWRKLQTSDHFYYMCTKWHADAEVHAYFQPYRSPYEAFMNFMNILGDFRAAVLGGAGDASGKKAG
ncbi:MAG: alpha-amylase [Bdellovibrionales bacterium RIFOXYD1_FULL_53_11]|nr:MAG: alpha-amylase [Bdellovibrionales bacterium RIFOXYD1_FULL_53_11]